MTRLFRRSSALTIAKPLAFFTQEPNAIIIRDLRVTAKIEKNLQGDPNSSEIVVYNLAERSRALLQEKKLHIRLQAGYDDNLKLIFSGDMVWSFSQKTGPDWVTKILLGDGHRAFNFARVNRSFRSGVTAKTALAEVAGSMGLSMPQNAEQSTRLLEELPGGITMSGPSRKQMDKILRTRGMSWSVQDGQLQILERDEVRADQAVLISEDTGMIGSPEPSPPDRSGGKPPTMTVQTLLDPRVSPGVKIRVESRSVTGNFKAQTVSHELDTHGEPWFTSVEATSL